MGFPQNSGALARCHGGLILFHLVTDFKEAGEGGGALTQLPKDGRVMPGHGHMSSLALTWKLAVHL